MKIKIKPLSTPLTILAALTVVCSAAADHAGHFATGSGQYEFTSTTGVTALRTFAFEARQSSDGGVTGEAQVDNRALGQRFHVRIDCLNVIGNIAVMSGNLTQAAGAGISVGDAAIFAVQDNGEGAGGPGDEITKTFENSGLVCTDVTPVNVGLYRNLLNDIEGGNVQIH